MIESRNEFEKLWNDAQALVCEFSATWCGPCQMLGPVLKKLEKDNPNIAFVKIDVDEQDDLSEEHKIRAMPTLLFVKKGKEIKRIVGYKDYETLSKQAKKLLAKEADR